MRNAKKGLVSLLVAALLAVGAPPATADHHAIMISEVFAGATGSAGVQYVELQMYQPGQHFLDGHSVRLYDSANVLVDTWTFTGDVGSGANQARVLLATTEAETFFELQADLEIDATIPPEGGKLCFESASLFGVIDCVAWGSYSGPSTHVGAPFGVTDGGIPTSASIHRTITRGNASNLDFADDSNVSANDFDYRAPQPQNNGGAAGLAPKGTLGFTQPSYSGTEGTAVTISYDRTDVTEAATFTTGSHSLSATEAVDFTSFDSNAGLMEGDGEGTSDADLIQDAEDEGLEEAKLTLRAPSAGVLLSRPNATLSIVDDHVDDLAPVTTVTKPADGQSYARNRFTRLRGQSEDDGAIVGVEVALRKTMKNGSCKWWNGSSFESGDCSSKLLVPAPSETAWTVALPVLLGRSVGTKVKFYTAFARAVDSGNNVESAFVRGRNANRFEIT